MQKNSISHKNSIQNQPATASLLQIIAIGLAIFTMYFGAGNLMYPISVGATSGGHWFLGIMTFIITAVLLPLAGLVGMILFDGDYNAFFNRLGHTAGKIAVGICIFIIGPVFVIPRIVSLSHTMLIPFMPFAFLQNTQPPAAAIFAILFLGITYITTYRENKIMSLLGNYISPILVISLISIIIKGILSLNNPVFTALTPLEIASSGFLNGYNTLDLLGSIFFASAALKILDKTLAGALHHNKRSLAIICLKAGLFGLSILAIIYVGLALLGAYHSAGITGNEAEMFQQVCMRVMGTHGSLLIAVTVFLACLSTAIPLSAICADYVRDILFQKKICFPSALALTLIMCLPLSIAGITTVKGIIGKPMLEIGYPILITLTFCNIAYKLYGFQTVKIPVLLTAIGSIALYIFNMIS